MTSPSPRIYTYKITFEEVPYYYYGVKKEKYFNQEYLGSPKTNKWCWELYTPKKQILEVFDYTDAGWLRAMEIEKKLIKPFCQIDKWCLNESCGGNFSLKTRRKSGKKVGMYCKQNKIGIFSLTTDERSKFTKLNYERGAGLAVLTDEQRSEAGKKGSAKNKENGIGIFSLTREQLGNQGKKTNAQKWECLETGFITNSGALSRYQKARDIDTSKRKRIG